MVRYGCVFHSSIELNERSFDKISNFRFLFFSFLFQLKTLAAKKTLVLTEEQSNRFERLCECRAARMPIQYIIGEWDFCDLVLKMVPPVFIPRPETEELVELILQQFDSKLSMRFMEIGCGSGAISLALLHALKMVCIYVYLPFYVEQCSMQITFQFNFSFVAGTMCGDRSK